MDSTTFEKQLVTSDGCIILSHHDCIMPKGTDARPLGTETGRTADRMASRSDANRVAIGAPSLMTSSSLASLASEILQGCPDRQRDLWSAPRGGRPALRAMRRVCRGPRGLENAEEDEEGEGM